MSDIDPCFVLKVTKLTKIGLKPHRKKIAAAVAAAGCSSGGGGGCEFFSKRYKGHRRYPLLLLLGVGRLAAATVCQLIMGVLSWSFARRNGSAADLYRLPAPGCPG